MTGQEHYRQAEVILGNVQRDITGGVPFDSVWLAAAQVHATLALAAATQDYDWDHAEQVTR